MNGVRLYETSLGCDTIAYVIYSIGELEVYMETPYGTIACVTFITIEEAIDYITSLN